MRLTSSHFLSRDIIENAEDESKRKHFQVCSFVLFLALLKIMLTKLNTNKIILMLIWEENDNDYEYLYYLFNFGIQMFEGEEANRIAQDNLKNFFQNPETEKFFLKVNNLLQNEIARNLNQQKIQKPKYSKLIFAILRFLQLNCEGHYSPLQNYLRYQIYSKYSYNLVILIGNLLCSYEIDDNNYKNAFQCFDTLTEFIQGPCKENQITVSNSKVVEHAALILSVIALFY